MNDVQKLKLNTAVSLLNRGAILLTGLILPRFILLYFGSATNGLVNSIRQFLLVITFLDLGVGSVVQSVLYKPLAKEDSKKTSEIMIEAKKYFDKIGYFLVIYIGLLIIFYPFLADSPLNWISTVVLIFAISISQLSQYYFGIVNEFLLNADQRNYIQLGVETVVVVLNLVVSVGLIILGQPIHVVKLVAGFVYLLRPFVLIYYVKRNYDINWNINVNYDPIPQKWSGMGQHIAYSINNSTDVIVLTIFSTLSNVSIYGVYYMITNAMKMIIQSFTTGFQSFFGSMLANEETKRLHNYFSRIEWGIHFIVVFLYSMTAILITEFIMLYTSGVYDVNYYQPIFAILLVIAQGFYSMRTPYQSLVFAAGHFKETQISSYIEAGLNIGLSVILVGRIGLSGVAIGTLIAMLYRTLYLVHYLSKNIIHRPLKIFAKQIMVDILTFGILLFIGIQILNVFIISNLIDWVIVAVVVGIVSLSIMLLINYIFYRKIVRKEISSLFKKYFSK